MRRLLLLWALVLAALLLAGVGALLSLICSVIFERSTSQ
jgi:hypothetical protein